MARSSRVLGRKIFILETGVRFPYGLRDDQTAGSGMKRANKKARFFYLASVIPATRSVGCLVHFFTQRGTCEAKSPTGYRVSKSRPHHSAAFLFCAGGCKLCLQSRREK